jgi:hypothetical protein
VVMTLSTACTHSSSSWASARSALAIMRRRGGGEGVGKGRRRVDTFTLLTLLREPWNEMMMPSLSLPSLSLSPSSIAANNVHVLPSCYTAATH